MHGRFHIDLPKMHERFRIGFNKVFGQFLMDPPKWHIRFRMIPPKVFHSICLHYISPVGKFWCTIAIMKEKKPHTFLFQIECYLEQYKKLCPSFSLNKNMIFVTCEHITDGHFVTFWAGPRK